MFNRDVRFVSVVAFLLVAVFSWSTEAFARGAGTTQFNWQDEWGTLPDELIPSSQHGSKKDINNAVTNCGLGDLDYGKIGTYYVDFNGDGKSDVVTDSQGYFSSGYNTSTCPIAICTKTYGCNISVYVQGAVVQKLADFPDDAPACPNDPANNKKCRPECEATVANCPGLFTYKMPLAWDGPVFDWSFITASAYRSFRLSAIRPDGTYKYRIPYSERPVFKRTVAAISCTVEEMDFNNDGVVGAGEVCTKYSQFYSGKFYDLYVPVTSSGEEDLDERMTTEFFNCKRALVKEDEPDTGPDCIGTVFNEDGQLVTYDGPGIQYANDWRKNEEGARLRNYANNDFMGIAYQIQGFPDPDHPGKPSKMICKQVHNETGHDLFFPTRSAEEVHAFNKAMAVMPGITFQDCAVRFTPWVGQTSCPSDLVCDEVRTIAAERRCVRASSATGDCSECSKISDPQPISGFQNMCQFTAVCVGPSCGGGGGNGGGGGGDCLSGDTRILMADGSEKPISQVVVGDRVMGFLKTAPLAPVWPVAVDEVTVTDAKTVVQINDVTISPEHLLTVQQGRVVRAEVIDVGSSLVGLSGQPVEVGVVGAVKEKVKVYNLGLDGADGFIANGIRVLKMPATDE